MASNWNTLMEGLQRVGLTQHEQRVLAAIARRTLGFNKTEDRIAVSQLEKATGLARRHVSTALDRLEERLIVFRQGGSPGRGKMATITLNLNTREWREKSHDGVTLESHTTARHFRPEKSHHDVPEKSHDGVTTKEREGVKHPPPTPSHATADPTMKPINQLAIEAYASTGGSLELAEWREALERNSKLLAGRGTDPRTILAAARQLGHEHSFPGYLVRRANELAAKGGPCEWEGLDRMALTLTQLSRCRCAPCREWATHRKAEETAA